MIEEGLTAVTIQNLAKITEEDTQNACQDMMELAVDVSVASSDDFNHLMVSEAELDKMENQSAQWGCLQSRIDCLERMKADFKLAKSQTFQQLQSQFSNRRCQGPPRCGPANINNDRILRFGS
jgi:hypothetical protein